MLSSVDNGHQTRIACQRAPVPAVDDPIRLCGAQIPTCGCQFCDAPKRRLVQQQINFCQRCGHALAEKEIEGRARHYCPACSFVVFLDPKVAAAVLVEVDGRLVLVRRGIEPAMGRWAFPSGYVDRGEALEEAAARVGVS